MTRRKRQGVLAALALAISAGAACESRLAFHAGEPPEQVSGSGFYGELFLRWTEVPGATGYVAYLSLSSSGEFVRQPIVEDEPGTGRVIWPDPSYTLQGGEPLYVRMSARVGNGETAKTDPIAVAYFSSPVAYRPVRTLRGQNAGDRFGSAVASGDLNGDGFADLVVGAPSFDSNAPGTSNGAAYLYYGSPYGLVADFDGRLEGTGSGDELGAAIAVGNVDGDAFDDVVIGSPGVGSGTGAVRLFMGNGTGPSLAQTFADFAVIAGSRFGSVVAIVDDVNGDGQRDVVVGAPDEGPGHAMLYLGSGSTLSFGEQYDGPQAGSRFGAALAGGDVFGDAHGDLLIGMPGADLGGADAGAVHVISGADVLPLVDATSLVGAVAGGEFGAALAVTRLDGDAKDDVIVGEPGWSHESGSPGRITAHLGGVTGTSLPHPIYFMQFGDENGERFGAAVAVLGTNNRESVPYVLAGAPGRTDGRKAGAISRSVLNDGDYYSLDDTIWQPVGYTPGVPAGAVVAAVGDQNGDGWTDVALAAPADGEGAVHLYLSWPFESPRVSAGHSLLSVAGLPVAPVSATFTDLEPFAHFRCTWSWGDGAVSVVEPCTPGNVGSVAPHAYAVGPSGKERIHWLKLRVESLDDGRFAEAITRVVVTSP